VEQSNDFNKEESNIWKSVTLSAVLYVVVIMMSGVAAFAGVTTYAKAGVCGHCHCKGCKGCCCDACDCCAGGEISTDPAFL